MKTTIILAVIFSFTAITILSQSYIPPEKETTTQTVVKTISNKSLGQEQLDDQNYFGAIRLFSACIKENDDSGDCRVGRGKAHLALGAIDWARANFLKALQMNPNNKEAAELLAKIKDPADASKITTEGVKSTQNLKQEDKKVLENILKAQDDLYNSLKTP